MPAMSISGPRRRSVVVVVLSAVTTLVGVMSLGALQAGAAVATVPAVGVAWVPSWSSDFSGASLPAGSSTYGGSYGSTGNAWSPSEVSVSGGLLRIRLEHTQTNGRAWTAGGVSFGNRAQTYGRYEIRAKIPRGAGIDSYFALWPAQGGEGRWTGVEMLAPGAETAYITNGWGAGSDGKQVRGSYSDGFHTYVLEWTPKLLRISQDGVPLYSSSRSYSGPRDLVLVVSNGDSLTGVPNASTPLPAEFLVDSVKVDRYEPGAGTTEVQPAGPTSEKGSSGTASASAGTPALAAGSTATSATPGAGAVPGAVPAATAAGAAATVDELPVDSPGSSAIVPWLVGVLLVLVLLGAIRAYLRSPQRAARAGAQTVPPVEAHLPASGEPEPEPSAVPAAGQPVQPWPQPARPGQPYPDQAYPDQAYPDQAYPDQAYQYPGQRYPVVHLPITSVELPVDAESTR
jgi:beta-glucanase (GH16 family)